MIARVFSCGKLPCLAGYISVSGRVSRASLKSRRWARLRGEEECPAPPVYSRTANWLGYFSGVGIFLQLSPLTLLHDDYHRIFQVVSDLSYCRQRYKLDESLIIVVLRKLYEEQSEQLSLAKDVVVTVGEVREEYRTITGKECTLGISQYEAILRRLRSLGLIEPLDGRSLDVRDSEARLRLRGSVKMILPVQTAEEMEAWLRKYRVEEARRET